MNYVVRVVEDHSLGTCLGPRHNGINLVCGWVITPCAYFL